MDSRCIVWQDGPATRDTNPMIQAIAEGINASRAGTVADLWPSADEQQDPTTPLDDAFMEL